LFDNKKATLIRHYRESSDKEPVVTAEKIRYAFLGFHVVTKPYWIYPKGTLITYACNWTKA